MEDSVRAGTHDFTMASRKAEETGFFLFWDIFYSFLSRFICLGLENEGRE